MFKLDNMILWLIKLAFLILVLTVAGTLLDTKEGTTQGILVDAAIEGAFISSCEIDIQYGSESSRIESYSTNDLEMCQNLKPLLGKKVNVDYQYSFFNWGRNTKYHIQKVTIID